MLCYISYFNNLISRNVDNNKVRPCTLNVPEPGDKYANCMLQQFTHVCLWSVICNSPATQLELIYLCPDT